jgi:hypothetical protein
MRTLLCTILSLAALGCSDDDGDDDEPSWNGIWITYPRETKSTELDSAWISGGVSNAGVRVTWTSGAQSGTTNVATSPAGSSLGFLR